MIKLKNLFIYFILSLSIIFCIKTLPSALHQLLLVFNIANKIGIDGTNCQTIFGSIVKANFEYGIFIVCSLIITLSLILLLRNRCYSLKTRQQKYNIIILFGLLVLLLFNGLNLYVTYLDMVENIYDINIFDRHIIFKLNFLLSIFILIITVILYILIWFDDKLDLKYKNLLLLLFIFLPFFICNQILSFIYMYGAVKNLDLYLPIFNNILSNLGLVALCMDNNPCNEYLKAMQHDCDLARQITNLPRIPGPPSTRGLRLFYSALKVVCGTDYKQKCENSSKEYTDCMNMFYTENNKNRRNT